MSKKITVEVLTRVEGHGAVEVVEENGKYRAKVKIFEGPRFYEYLVVGQGYINIPRIVSRICGICYISHRTASARAIEDAFGAKLPEELEALRRLANVGAFMESHGLHIYFLALPDYFGYDSLLEMVHEYPNLVERGFKVKNSGVEIMKLIGGKNFHGENLIAGGFASLPSKEELKRIEEILEGVKEDLIETLHLMGRLKHPSLEVEREYQLAVYNPDRWEIYGDKLILKGEDGETIFTKNEYEIFVEEEPVEYSMAKQSRVKGKPVLLGPLARVNIYRDKLSEETKKLLSDAGIKFPSTNPFHQNIARAVELLELREQAVRLIDDLLSDYPAKPNVELKPKKGRGFGVVEAPRGTLYHTYEFDENGYCTNSNIITPTAVLQTSMERDAQRLAKENSDKPLEEVRFLVERLIRSYDPCISCSVHSYKVL
ncbi:MAG TPA: Ni/Fe hydrogenase subunit alpha [Aquificales bacterium]|nr:Ni/Fe hydrogenase subunit alpha [Aquificales bacterium]